MSNQMVYQLNTFPLKLGFADNWYFMEIDFDNFKDEYYSSIIEFRRHYEPQDFILESTGRILVVIPNTDNDNLDIDKIKNSLEEELGNFFEFPVILNILEIEINKETPEDIKNAIRNGLGGKLEHKLENLGFEKVKSKGSVGRFFHYDLSETKELQRDKVTLRRLYDFTVHIQWEDPISTYLTIDIVTEVDGEETLYELIKSKKDNLDISKWPKDQRKWKIKELRELSKLDKGLLDANFRLKKLLDYSEGIKRPHNLRKRNKEQTLYGFIKEMEIKFKPNEKIAELTAIKYGDPNSIYYLPSSLLFHKITNSSVNTRSWKNIFHKFSIPKMKERRDSIIKIAELLKDRNIIDDIFEFKTYPIDIAYPAVNKNYEKRFGKTIDLSRYGVQEWGNMEEIEIYSTNKFEDIAEDVKYELNKQLGRICQITGVNKPRIKCRTIQKNDVKRLVEEVDKNNPDRILKIFISNGGKKYFPSYKYLKEAFTQDLGVPIQIIKTKSLQRNVGRIIKTLIPQLIAKTGGQPYTLYPKILDKALIIGLDKARDSGGTKPSASAGISAVTPEGKYVAGVSTYIDNTKDDRIDVSELAPKLLQSLKDRYKDLEYVVILRDGSPATCREEVKQWRKYVEEYNMKMVFFAARKKNQYRVFPKYMMDEDKRPKLQLPVILNGKPLPKNEFLVVTANSMRGTPQPALYTLMENTVGFSTEDIKKKVLAQVISMSMLCWESPMPTSQPLPLHYADKLAAFTQMVQQKWKLSIKSPMFI